MNSRIVRFVFGAIFAVTIAMTLLAPQTPILARTAPSTTFSVNSNSDASDFTINGVCETGSGNGVCTLRAAIQEANATSGATINFGLGGSVIYLLTLGDLSITSNVTIVGNGTGNTIIDGNANSRLFTISSASTVVNISGVTIRNGLSDLGGGIHSAGILSLNNVMVTNNHATVGNPRSGGGIWNSGTLTVTNSFINGNTAIIPFSGGGGGIYNGGGTVLLDRTTLDSNMTDLDGGAIQVDGGTVSLVNSTVNSNFAQYGGGIFNGGLSGSGTLNITNSGIFSNTATVNAFPGGGGGIENNNGVATILNSTVFLNAANRDGGGINNNNANGAVTRLYNATVALNFADYDHDQVGAGGGMTGTVTFRNSILASNLNVNGICISCTAPDDCGGTFNSEDFNLIQSTSGCTFVGSTANNKTGVDPMFSYPIAYNGGPTLNLALLPGSPAINAGNTGGCRDILGALIPTDQRGYARVAPCDIGAFEYVLRSFLPLVLR